MGKNYTIFPIIVWTHTNTRPHHFCTCNLRTPASSQSREWKHTGSSHWASTVAMAIEKADFPCLSSINEPPQWIPSLVWDNLIFHGQTILAWVIVLYYWDQSAQQRTNESRKYLDVCYWVMYNKQYVHLKRNYRKLLSLHYTKNWSM